MAFIPANEADEMVLIYAIHSETKLCFFFQNQKKILVKIDYFVKYLKFLLEKLNVQNIAKYFIMCTVDAFLHRRLSFVTLLVMLLIIVFDQTKVRQGQTKVRQGQTKVRQGQTKATHRSDKAR